MLGSYFIIKNQPAHIYTAGKAYSRARVSPCLKNCTLIKRSNFPPLVEVPRAGGVIQMLISCIQMGEEYF